MSENEFYAYGKNRASIEAVMRFHAVKRWHMIDTTRQQTLAEHSANVALLAYHIALHAPLMIFGGALAVSGMALLHDIDEVFTGDIPTHTKQHLIGLQELEDQNTPQ
ncbi:HD domain containing protein, partial [uncultured Caudovirales phage]